MKRRGGRRQISSASGKARELDIYIFFSFTAMGVTEGSVSRKAMCVNLMVRKICWAEAGKHRQGESLGEKTGGRFRCGGVRGGAGGARIKAVTAGMENHEQILEI